MAAMLACTGTRQGSKGDVRGILPLSKKPCNGFFNEKCMIREKLMVKQKLMVTDLIAPLNVGELRGYLALIQSAFLSRR